MAQVTFEFKEFKTKFPIAKTVSMENICQKYSHFINIPLKNLYFFYKANKLDLKLSFNDIAKEEDKITGKIEIFTLLNEEQIDLIEKEKNETKDKIINEKLINTSDHLKKMNKEDEINKKNIEFDFKENKVIEDHDLINEIFEEIEGEYGISGFMLEDEVKNKIRELNYDKNKIEEWIEKMLISN